MAKCRFAPPGRHHHAGKLRELGQQRRRRVDELLRAIAVELAFEPLDLALLERLHDHQRVDEKPIAPRCGHPARGSVRTGDQTHVFQVGHHVADRGWRKLESRMPGKHARAHRLTFGDVALDQRFQQMLGSGIHLGRHSTARRLSYRGSPTTTQFRREFIRTAWGSGASAYGLIGP